MIDIIPGIFEADTKELVRKIALVLPYVSSVQIDIADNTLVSKRSSTDINGIGKNLGQFRKNELILEAHLIASQPEQYIKALAENGFSRIIGHVECEDPRNFLAEARTFEFEVGLAINTDTEVEILEPYLEELDFVLVMTAESDGMNEVFQSEVVEKIKAIHRNFSDLPIEVDGGITLETAKIAADAGATRLVSSSYIFDKESEIQKTIEELSRLS